MPRTRRDYPTFLDSGIPAHPTLTPDSPGSASGAPVGPGASRPEPGASLPKAGAALREHVRAHAENRPGVYRMLGAAGRILYVGKSIRVRSRLLSYFRADRGEKAAEILSLAERVEWDDQPSEFAALLREFRQIRRHRPPFNVQHKRERAVCFIRIPREPAARLLVTTSPREDGAEYFGPLLGAERTRDAVRVLVDALELRDCAATTTLRLGDQADLFGTDYPPLCARAELRRCLAPCAAGCTEREYAERLEVGRRFLHGQTSAPLDRLRQDLRRAVERWLFEYAAVLVERIDLLEGVRSSLLRLERGLDALSGSYLVPGHAGEDRVYLLQRGLVRAELPSPRDGRERRRLRERIDRLFGAPPPPPGRIGPDGLAEMLLVERWFRRNPTERERVRRL